MQKTILTQFFSRSQFLIWGLAIFGMLAIQGNAYGQCATVSTVTELENEGFEGGGASWNFFNGANVDNTNANTGTMHGVVPFGGGVAGIFQGDMASQDEEWTAGFEVLVPSTAQFMGATFGSIKLVFRNANNDEIGAAEMIIDANFPLDVYTNVTVVGTAPAGTVAAEIFALIIDNGGAGGTMFIDDGFLSSNMDLCGTTVSVTTDADCNDPFVTFPDLVINTPTGCTVSSVTNDFNAGMGNASGNYPLGPTVVTYTAVDNAGSSTCVITVDVLDMTAPAVSCGGLANPGFDGFIFPAYSIFPGPLGDGVNYDGGFGNANPGMAVLFHGSSPVSGISQDIPTFEGEEITVGASVLGANFNVPPFSEGTASVVAKIEFYDAAGVIINGPFGTDLAVFDNTNPDGVWIDIAGTITAPVGAVTARPVIIYLDFNNSFRTALVDDFVYENSFSSINVDNNNEDCMAFVDLNEYMVTDACGMVTTTNDYNGAASADGLYPLGTTVVTFTFEDEAGNTSECMQTVINDAGGLCAMVEIADPCVCLNNATNNIDGQFGELVEVNGSTGQIWTVTASTGLYIVDANDASVQATPGVVYPLAPVTGIQLVENPAGSGIFQLAGVHIDAIGYGLTLENLFSGQEIQIVRPPATAVAPNINSSICLYPTIDVTNLSANNNVCLADSPFDFSVSPNVAGQLDVIVDGASVFSGAVTANSNTPISVDVTALGTGTYAIEVTFDGDNAAVPNPGCGSTYDYTLTVGEPQGTLSCNDNIQVSLDQNCEAQLNADMILEGTYTGAFDISIAGVTGTILNGSHIGNTYTVTVSDACGVNSCWSMVSVEDKLAPTIACIDVVTVCTEDINNVAQPTAFDNCTGATLQLIENVLADDDACDDGRVRFVQTYIAIDAQGNQSAPCQRTVNVLRPDADQVNFPDDLVWSCEQYAAYPYIVDPTRINPTISNGFGTTYSLFGSTNAWDLTNISIVNVNNNLLTQLVPGTDPARATGSGIPTEIDGVYCQYGYTFADDVVSACGMLASTDSPVFKIVRTWTVLDWCTGNIVTGNANGEDNVQIIKVIDEVAPIVVGANITVSANIPGAHPQPCKSTGPVQMATATDNCTGATQIQGFIYTDIALNSAVAQVSSNGTINPALPVGSYFVVWTAEDGCANVGQSTTYTLTIQDDIKPVMVCDEITQVALSSDGLAVVYAETFDDGSYDNCCLDRLEVRRMSQTCGVLGNTTFDNDGDSDDSSSDPDDGEFVTFCCTDVVNNGTDANMVVLRAYDCDNNFNECMVEVLVEDKLAPTITCPPNASLTCDEFQDDLQAALLACTDGGFAIGGFADEDDCQSAALTVAGYGEPIVFDNCEVTIDTTVTVTVDQCGAGSIVRSYTATDVSGNGGTGPAVCTQTIIITNVSDWVVEFPADQSGFCDMAEPEFGEPEIFFESCELIATSFDDQFFDIVADACFKIVRTWTVINWCVVGNDIDQESNAVELSEADLPASSPINRDLDGDGDRDNRTFRDSYRGVLPTTDNDPDTDRQDGFITYQQIIKIQDDEAPVIDPLFAVGDLCIIEGNDGTDDDYSDCTFSGVLPTPGYDDCILDVNGNLDSNGETIDNALVITATVFDSNGNVVSNSVVVSDLAIGCYVVRYVAVDRCGNTTATDYDFCIEDCKFPTPYCKDGVVLELMHINDPNNTTFEPMVELWASDLDLGSFDNCDADVQLSFSANVNDIGNVYSCDGSLNGQAVDGAVGENMVELWVTDAAGNQDFCTTFVIIQANQDQCNNGTPLVAVAGGAIADENNEMAENVMVQMSGQSNGTNMTAVDGNYNFNVPMGNDVTITPSNDEDHDNGVSTFDLVLISKHILGTQTLDSPYKLIAADANNSGNISTLDLVQVRKLILQIDTEFNSNTSWRFVDADFVFPNPSNPWATVFPEVININNIDNDMMANNFVAVKIGDVNTNATANTNLLGADDRSAGKLVIAAKDRMVKAGETVTVDFTTVEAVQGYQFTMNFNAALDFVGMNDGVASEENFGFAMLSERAITASWNGEATANTEAFSMTFTANADIMLSDALTINSRYTTAEAYNTNNDLLDVALNFNAATVATFELYQNAPNPFQGETAIGFNLPEAGAATLTIADVSGRVLTVIEGDYAKGYNQVTVSDLPSTGVLYYTLNTANETATKKMVSTK